MQQRTRLKYVDVFRGVGILLMVMGHIGFSGIFDKFIHAFHMPMFFFVTGYFYRSKNDMKVSQYLLKKVKTLLLPYIVFGLFHFGVWLALNWDVRSLDPLCHLLFENTTNMPISGALWFLTSLFFADVIYFFTNRYVKCDWIKHVIVFVIVMIGHFAKSLIAFRLPYGLDAAFVGVGLIHSGHIARAYEKRTGRSWSLKKFWVWILLVVAVVALIFMNPPVNMRTGDYGTIILFWFNAIGSIFVGWTMAMWIDEHEAKNRFLRAGSDYLAKVGNGSIVYVCLNQLVILLWQMVVPATIPTWARSFLLLGLSMAVLYVIQVLFEKTRLRKVIGK